MPQMTISELSNLIGSYRIRFDTEARMQDDIADVFTRHSVPFTREFAVGTGAIDFLVGDVGIECKTKGSSTSVLRQVLRYAEEGAEIAKLLLVTSKASHRWHYKSRLCDKPFRTLWVGAGRL